jgi:hypothetical protein
MTTALTAVCNGTATTIGDRVATARPPKPGVCHSERAYIACRSSEIVWHVYGEIETSAVARTWDWPVELGAERLEQEVREFYGALQNGAQHGGILNHQNCHGLCTFVSRNVYSAVPRTPPQPQLAGQVSVVNAMRSPAFQQTPGIPLRRRAHRKTSSEDGARQLALAIEAARSDFGLRRSRCGRRAGAQVETAPYRPLREP